MDVTVHVKLKAKQSGIVGTRADGVLQMHVRSAPEDNAANLEVIEVLSKVYNVPRSQIELLNGHTRRTKRLRIHTK